MTSPEPAARETIDCQLQAAGWRVAAPGSEIDGRPTALGEASGDTGRADYVLYLDGKTCGILEAKRSDHLVRLVLDAFCKKITFSAVPSKTLIGNFRNSPEWRIAVTVDMIATGTDIKPLECLIFLRDVRTELLYTQMKSRGCRTVAPNDLANVTPDALGGQKTHFALIDILSQDTAEAPKAITPRRTIESFEQFRSENRDGSLALLILYNQSAGPGALTYEAIRGLRDTLAQSPYHLAPEVVWQAYATLEKTTPATPSIPSPNPHTLPPNPSKHATARPTERPVHRRPTPLAGHYQKFRRPQWRFPDRRTSRLPQNFGRSRFPSGQPLHRRPQGLRKRC